MDKGSGLLLEEPVVARSRPEPRLRLLIEWESRGRAFFDNLVDLLLRRKAPPVRITSRPARFWNDVFVPSGFPWTSIVESVLWHFLLLIVFVWGQSHVWVRVKTFQERDAFRHSVVYYPTKSFPASGGRVMDTPTNPHAKARLPHPPVAKAAPPMPVTPEHKPAIVTPPDLKQAAARPPDLPAPNAVAPMAPFSATPGPRRNALAGPAGVVAPAPEVDPGSGRKLAVPEASAVAPAPELGGPSAGRSMAVPGTVASKVVPPPPSLQAGSGRSHSMSGSGAQVVPPPAVVQSAGDAARAGRVNALPGAAANVVPPTPSLGSGNHGDARVNSMSAGGTQVVQPPPSLQSTGDPARAGRMTSASGVPANVVPPAPALQSPGNPEGGARIGTLTGTGTQVIPPPPSVQGRGNSVLSGGPASAGQPVPPPPSFPGAGGPGGGTRVGSLSGAGSEVVPPTPSLESGGNAGASGRLGTLSGDASQAAPPPTTAVGDPPVAAAPAQQANAENNTVVEELPLGFLGLVWAPPGTSYFSNFEVFVAKRKVNKDQIQLIKLVYEFLPYQRRLSDYDLNNLPPRVIKLRVTPDPSCNESLTQMMQVQTDPELAAKQPTELPPALRSSDLNAVLPCYRTTADDFRKAMSRGR